MKPTDPATWRCPSDGHPDSDAEWEFPQLKRLAERLLESSPELEVQLNWSDPTTLFFSVLRSGTKVGEVYVNREEPGSEAPIFSAFAGEEEDELHGSSLDDAVSHLVRARGAWGDEADEAERTPAASISDVDLDSIPEREAEEIARLGEKMEQGEDTEEDFLRLCQLLYTVGHRAKSEYLLRRNLEEGEPGHDLYIGLFGTVKQEEFESAVEAFKSQFDVEISFVEKCDFLDWEFHSQGGPPRSDAFALLERPCEVRFSYSDETRIECNVVLLDPTRTVFKADERLFMYYLNGVWEIADQLDE
jgi:hypothetical protein